MNRSLAQPHQRRDYTIPRAETLGCIWFLFQPDAIASMRIYRYTPLEADEIRLLELQSGDDDAELQGSLHRYRLPEDVEPKSGTEVLLTREGGFNVPNAPNYEALSYTWGENARSRLFLKLLDENRFAQMNIKPNLDAALRRLRRDIPRDQSRMIWCDAICINQVRDRNETGDRHSFSV